MKRHYLMTKKFYQREGFTLPELLMGVMILLILFVGVMFTFVKCMEYSEMAKNKSAAVTAARSRMAQIDNTAFNQVMNTFNNTTFTAANLTGKGVTYVDNSNPELLQIITTFCWREKNGRVIGEDIDVDGVLDAGEDQNANGRLDSVVQLSTLRSNL